MGRRPARSHVRVGVGDEIVAVRRERGQGQVDIAGLAVSASCVGRSFGERFGQAGCTEFGNTDGIEPGRRVGDAIVVETGNRAPGLVYVPARIAAALSGSCGC